MNHTTWAMHDSNYNLSLHGLGTQLPKLVRESLQAMEGGFKFQAIPSKTIMT